MIRILLITILLVLSSACAYFPPANPPGTRIVHESGGAWACMPNGKCHPIVRGHFGL